MKISALTIAGGMLVSGLSQADPNTGWYSRVSVNRTAIDYQQTNGFVSTIIDSSQPGVDQITGSISLNVDTTETGFDVAFGYHFTPNFGLELGYADLGEHLFQPQCDAAVCTTQVLDFEVTPTAVSLLGIAALPITDQFSAYAVLGATAIDTELGNSTEPEAGIGATWQTSNELALDFRYSQLVYDELDDFEVFELGLRYSF